MINNKGYGKHFKKGKYFFTYQGKIVASTSYRLDNVIVYDRYGYEQVMKLIEKEVVVSKL